MAKRPAATVTKSLGKPTAFSGVSPGGDELQVIDLINAREPVLIRASAGTYLIPARREYDQRGVLREPVTFAYICSLLIKAVVAAVLAKLSDALFGKGGGSNDLRAIFDQLIREIGSLITAAIAKALDDYQEKEALDQLLAAGDMVARYHATKHLPTLENALDRLDLPLRRFASLPDGMGYGGYCLAATLQIAVAEELLLRKSKTIDKQWLLRVIDGHELSAVAQSSIILSNVYGMKVGGHENGNSMATYPATNEGDASAPEKRDPKTFLFTLGPTRYFKVWLTQPERYSAAGWALVAHDENVPATMPNHPEYYARLKKYRSLEHQIESARLASAQTVLNPAADLRTSWQLVRGRVAKRP
jgi:hypothetical protein